STGGSNRIGLDGAGTTTLGANVVIRGENGTVGAGVFVGGAHDLINNGRISADVSGGLIALNPSGGTTNAATLEALNGGTLRLDTAVTASGSGHIDATGAGSRVVQNGATITGGTINTTGGGVLAPTNNGNNFLNGVMVNGTIDLATATAIERIGGGTTINTSGAFNINSNSILSFQGTQSIGTTGIGNIVLGDTGSSNRIAIEGGTTLTVDAGVIIHGQNGTIGSQVFAGGAADLINNGTIATDVNGGLITIAPNGSLTNSGTLRAANGGTLTVSPAIAFTNLVGTTLAGGTYEVIAGGGTSNLRLPNANIIANAATILLDGANSNLLNNNTSGDALANLATNATTTTPGSFTIQNGRNFTTAGAFANNALGVVTIGNSSTFNSTGAFSNGGKLAMRGGAFNAPSLLSSAEVNGNGTVNPTIQNTGAVRAFGGTLTATNGVTGTSGTVQSDAGGTLAIGAVSTAGILTNNGNLALGANTVTVSNAYNNANFGAGNSFNNRANVTGAGQILAAGATPGTAQTLSGNIVPTPTSGNATMNFGNIHVGSSSTLNYQIGNVNIGGPSLLGAIQTSVNGGNITDTRLSGAGVTAANWGSVAAGGNTGNLGVTFNATSGGTLTGQQVHIRNNFDNTNAQNLIITGAAFNLASGNATPAPIVFANAHVGDTRTQVLTVGNTAPASAFTEGLNASFGVNAGNVSNNAGSINLLAGGATNNSAMSVTLDTTAAGARSGTATLNYASDGSGTSGLGQTAAGSQVVTVSGNVYRLASANALAAINFGNVHVNDAVQQALNITNTAVADSFSEKLNASFGASSDARITTNGSINQLAAGSSNNSSMVVGLNTVAAGTVNGTQVVNFASDGAGTSGLGITALTSQTIGVSGNITTVGNVFRLASASAATPNPVNFGNVRIGTVTDQALSITNTAANDGFSEKLNASITTNGAPVTASGAFNLLGPTATDNSSLHVGLNTGSAGAKSGSATIALVSDGAGTSNLGTTALTAQTVNVSGAVYRLASPTLNTPSVNLVARVGDAAPSANVSISNSSPDVFTEGLKASIGGTSAPFTSSGAVANLAAQGTAASSLQVGLNTATAGTSAGIATVNFSSTGAGTTGAADVSVGSAIVNLAGKVYQQAVAQVNTTLVNFGIVHVGDTVSPQAVSVTNAAPVAALNDVLQGDLSPISGPFSTTGTLGAGLAAGANDNSSLKVALNTATAGIYSGTTTARLVSHDADQADLVINGIPVALSAQVNNFANADIAKSGGAGTLSRSGNNVVLDFGQVQQGGTLSTMLSVLNNVLGPADLLSGFFDLTGANNFLFSGFNPFSDLAAGSSQGGYGIGFNRSSLGSFSDTILLSAIGSNASGYSDTSRTRLTLQIRGNVVAGTVPEPGTLFLLPLGLLLILLGRRRHLAI
ncbi:MAG: choice-of-anchor D domain-containing protein, partial [Gammaproteobacteria bacterium]|nr:choice-of-anchor D domain-containing protein [Gammaproteobacteria bacterium]